MRYLTHDGSFAGILSCIYFAYENQLSEVHISTEDVVFPTLFTQKEFIATDYVEAKKVAKRMIELVGYRRFMDLFRISHSSNPLIGNKIFELIQFVQLHKGIMLYDYSHPAIKSWIKDLKEIKNKVNRITNEFKNHEEECIYFEPEFDCIQLLFGDEDFISSYSDLTLFDTKREYGLMIKEGIPSIIGSLDLQEGVSISYDYQDLLQEKLWVYHLQNYKPNRVLRNRKANKAS